MVQHAPEVIVQIQQARLGGGHDRVSRMYFAATPSISLATACMQHRESRMISSLWHVLVATGKGGGEEEAPYLFRMYMQMKLVYFYCLSVFCLSVLVVSFDVMNAFRARLKQMPNTKFQMPNARRAPIHSSVQSHSSGLQQAHPAPHKSPPSPSVPAHSAPPNSFLLLAITGVKVSEISSLN